MNKGGGWKILDSTEIAGPDNGNISEGVGIGNYLISLNSLKSLKTVYGGVWVSRERIGGGDWTGNIVDNLWSDHSMTKAFSGGVGKATSQTVRLNNSGGAGSSQDGGENNNLIDKSK